MIISLKWLNEFVEISDFFDRPSQLADLLTKAGLEVENIVDRARDYRFVVTALILHKEKHPQADKLTLCRVTTGEGVVHQIVCGAKNHQANDKVVLALPGAELPGGLAISKTVIRGVESGGMLCSEKELGISAESSGLLILPEATPIGKAYAEYAELNDVTFELKVTPNRADCLSHFGLARELSCLLSRPLKAIHSSFAVADASTKNEITLEIKEPEMCPRYCGRFIDGIKVAPSPEWLKRRLESVGLHSINNIVDVTNYVMLETGQPLHAFDVSQIKEKTIRVEKSKPGEEFKTLDGTLLKLSGEELMIKDKVRSIALAGVVGGLNSGINESTRQVFIEAAYFRPGAVRKTARKFGINTDSSYRFSRGVDPDSVFRSMDRAVELILKFAGGAAYSDHHDSYPKPIVKDPIQISLQTVSERIGYPAEQKTFIEFMTRLGCEVVEKEPQHFRITPPTFRFDIEGEMDLVEEYARLNGYEHIPEAAPWVNSIPAANDLNFMTFQKVAKFLAGEGLFQASNFAFVGKTAEAKFLGDVQKIALSGLEIEEEKIELKNPLSDDLNVMRSSLSFGLFKNLVHNFHQEVFEGSLFEIGKTFQLANKMKTQDRFQEHWKIGFLFWGSRNGLWNKSTAPLFYYGKEILDHLASNFGLTLDWEVPAQNSAPDFLHSGQTAILKIGQKNIGFFGALHPLLMEENKLRGEAICGEISFEPWVAQQKTTHFQSVSRFPGIKRDLALMIPAQLLVAKVMTEIRATGGEFLRQVEVFDVFTGGNLPAGQRSVAFRMHFQNKFATLHDETVNTSMSKIVKSLEEKFGLSVR